MSDVTTGGAEETRTGFAAGRRVISVLVVDDDGDIRETLADLLQDEGYSVETASNGAEALDALRRLRPTVILLDLSMPLMCGQEFRMEQLANPTLAEIPTVVMTAADRAQEKTQGMHVNEILAKPVKMQQLLDVVARHCRLHPTG
jgi:CheY-like chemotaxis protein